MPNMCVCWGQDAARSARNAHAHQPQRGHNFLSHPADTVIDSMTQGPDFNAIQATSRHGTCARYKAGCHCDQCRAADTAYQRQRRQVAKHDGPKHLRVNRQTEPGGLRR